MDVDGLSIMDRVGMRGVCVLEAKRIGDRLTVREAGTRVGCWKIRRDGKWLPLFNQVDAGRRELSAALVVDFC